MAEPSLDGRRSNRTVPVSARSYRDDITFPAWGEIEREFQWINGL
jgi:hypothetical protein